MNEACYYRIACHRMREPPEYPWDTHPIKNESCWYSYCIVTSLESNMVGKIL